MLIILFSWSFTSTYGSEIYRMFWFQALREVSYYQYTGKNWIRFLSDVRLEWSGIVATFLFSCPMLLGSQTFARFTWMRLIVNSWNSCSGWCFLTCIENEVFLWSYFLQPVLFSTIVSTIWLEHALKSRHQLKIFGLGIRSIDLFLTYTCLAHYLYAMHWNYFNR